MDTGSALLAIVVLAMIASAASNGANPTGTPVIATTITTTTTLPSETVSGVDIGRIKGIIRSAVESHTYVWAGMGETSIETGVERYNCQDFSRDAMLALRENGYNAYAMNGLASSQTLAVWTLENDPRLFEHVWVRVEQNGMFADFEATNSQVLESGTLIRLCESSLFNMNGTNCVMADENYKPLWRTLARGVW